MTWLSEANGIPGVRYGVSWRDADGKWYQLLNMGATVANQLYEAKVSEWQDAANRDRAVQEVHIWEYAPKIVKSFDADFTEVVE